ncbi:class I SAM-dependent methyltransferase [Tenggerimyces flavus]|uniref:Class I SAM-dependent methyltransferase n=1 Tax=Tenggerimyces flavus TaxID=1708749 RepID=A0ABV7Y2X0_9ACTN|nr:class I SAM-dependent methyltransferase [Tenggerimyces flavus]MBM7790627.1 SAM-dependent methyltransferase [Tenggerimyces flavus]
MTDPYVIEWSEARDRLNANAREDADWYAIVAERLCRPTDGLRLDIGCGGAGMARALADVPPDTARVIGLDGNAEILGGARKHVAGTRVELSQCDLERGPAAVRELVQDQADLIWASAVVHHVADQQATVDGLATLLAPGGRLALAEGGLATRHLPWDVGVGEPGLEVRLQAAQDQWFRRMRAELPGQVPMPYGWTEALTRAGLNEVTTFTILVEKSVPLSNDERYHVLRGLETYLSRIRETGLLGTDDLAAWDKLLDPESPHWLGNLTDVFSLAARSVHVGAVG